MRLLSVFVACIGFLAAIGCEQKKEAKGPMVVASWTMVQTAAQDEAKFKEEYLEKEVKLDNLVTFAVWKSDTEQYADAFAYDPATETIYTHGSSKLAGKPVKSGDSDFFIKLIFSDPAQLDSLQDNQEEDVGGVFTRNYHPPYSVIGKVSQIDGNNITISAAKLAS